MKIKKVNTFLLTVILAVCFIWVTPLQKASADDPVLTGYSTFAQSYFDNLTNNFGNNQVGSCGYVAIGMLLSYYDTFLNDSIIPEQYDVVPENNSFNTNMVERANSPGISYETLDKSTPEAYLSAINSIKDDSLHAKLISIGYDLGFYNSDPNSIYYCGLSRGDQYLVIKHYLEDVINLSETDDYSIDTKMNLLGYTSNTVKNWAIEKINAGIPVLLTVFKDNENNSSVSGDSEEDTKDGHCVIGYDVDDDGNILCHFGWRYPLYTRETPEAEGYTYYDSAIALDFNIEHSCSNNYVVRSYDENYNVITNYYCYHHKDIITYDHICDFNYSSSPLESTDTNRHLYHAAYCHCTNSIAVEHYYFNLSCTKCGYQCEHKYSYTCVDDLTHRGVCQYCTHTKLGRHVFKIGSRTCLECYAIIFDGFIAYPYSIAIAYSANGSYILSNGCIMLAPADIESYFKGTLVFNNSNAVPEII